MRIMIENTNDKRKFIVHIAPEKAVNDLKLLCEEKTGVSASMMILMHEGCPLLDDDMQLRRCNVNNNDTILLQQLLPIQQRRLEITASDAELSDGNGLSSLLAAIAESKSEIPHPSPIGRDKWYTLNREDEVLIDHEMDPVAVFEAFVDKPESLISLKLNNPLLADTILSGDLDAFTAVWQEQRLHRAHQRKRIHKVDANNVEEQRRIAAEIRGNSASTQSNRDASVEYLPELFGSADMLYINCRVNGFHVKAFVDTGAQTSILSEACAKRCDLHQLIDTRWNGIATGVGLQTINGRIHLVELTVENKRLDMSCIVLRNQPMDLVLGLDMLRRHRCKVDLQRGVLSIGTTGTESHFLPEAEIPYVMEYAVNLDDEVPSELLMKQQEELKRMQVEIEKNLLRQRAQLLSAQPGSKARGRHNKSGARTSGARRPYRKRGGPSNEDPQI